MKEKYEEIACDVVIFETNDNIVISDGSHTGSLSGILPNNP